MKGLYLYCIRKKGNSKFAVAVEGIGGEEVYNVPYHDLQAVVSEVSLKEFGSGEIQKRATEDMAWIKDTALMHEAVIETVMNNSDGLIIPLKFGVIFKERESLMGSLKKNYLKFKNLLSGLQGKEEWSMKIYCQSKPFENEIKKSSPIIQSKLEEIKSLPAGRQYFLKEEINEMAKREARGALSNYISIFLEKLNGLAEELKENQILGKELTRKSDSMVFNGAFLVKKEKVDKFRGEIQKLPAEYEKIGFTFESSGPWPPYNFVSL